jgi:hypothetical protein
MRSDEFKEILIYLLTLLILIIEYNDLFVFNTLRLCSSYIFVIGLVYKIKTIL